MLWKLKSEIKAAWNSLLKLNEQDQRVSRVDGTCEILLVQTDCDGISKMINIKYIVLWVRFYLNLFLQILTCNLT